MKIAFLILFTSLISQILFSQDEIIIPESNTNSTMLVGEFKRELLQHNEFGQLFMEEYLNYHPDMEIINKFQHRIYNYSITIVLATWCHDSQIQVPRFFKILDKIDYNTNFVRIVCVDKDKTGGETDISNLNLELVPTFIFYKNDAEMGRIIESPINTLEADILSILNE